MTFDHRASGVLLHVTSLPGPHGIGDFGPSAFHFIDWLETAGQRLWQVLPLTPIGPGNSPYQSVSAFAGSPLMVALEPLVERGWLAPPDAGAAGFGDRRVDFARVVDWRNQQLRRAAEGFATRAAAHEREAFERWCTEQAGWVDDYALFMALERAHSGRPWWLWPAALAKRRASTLAAARKAHAAEIGFWKFVQWCFDEQWRAVKAYANGKGIAIMGDLPIFIAHHSADCWSRPDLYHLDDHFQPSVVAGVPPDFFSATGQRWGNPLYRWDRMADEDYAWWTARVARALQHMDVFRIDHFRGFAANWEIPSTCPTAVEGRWAPGPGKPLFDAIERALGRLPIVAEDLGIITPDVVQLREACGFPGMRVLQFAFSGDATHAFLPHNYARNTVVYSGTHDNDTTLGWWAHATGRERAFAGAYLESGQHDLHWAMIRAACESVAELAVFPMQDVLGLDHHHRMNRPGSAEGNWEWRFDWAMVGPEPARRLGRIGAATGRSPIGLLGLPEYPEGKPKP
jgi:4-alpha-glucanotransferase